MLKVLLLLSLDRILFNDKTKIETHVVLDAAMDSVRESDDGSTTGLINPECSE